MHRDDTSTTGMGAQTSADLVAVEIRRRILEGELQSGVALRDQSLAEEFQVSRNTVREALRSLQRDRLASHERNRGTTVGVLDEDDVRDIYRARRALELQAIVQSLHAPRTWLETLESAVVRSERLVRARDWRAVGTASLDFHVALVATLGSRSLNEFAAATLARLRLAFSRAADERGFQLPWVARDRQVNDLVQTGQVDAAHDAMRLYLDDSEAQVRGVLRMSARVSTPHAGHEGHMKPSHENVT